MLLVILLFWCIISNPYTVSTGASQDVNKSLWLAMQRPCSSGQRRSMPCAVVLLFLSCNCRPCRCDRSTSRSCFMPRPRRRDCRSDCRTVLPLAETFPLPPAAFCAQRDSGGSVGTPARLGELPLLRWPQLLSCLVQRHRRRHVGQLPPRCRSDLPCLPGRVPAGQAIGFPTACLFPLRPKWLSRRQCRCCRRESALER